MLFNGHLSSDKLTYDLLINFSMVQFCDAVTKDILRAAGSEVVEEVVRNSFVSFREKKNSYNETTYIINMIVTLQAAKPHATTIPEVNNLSHAVKLFRKYHGTTTSGLF